MLYKPEILTRKLVGNIECVRKKKKIIFMIKLTKTLGGKNAKTQQIKQIKKQNTTCILKK